MEAEIIRMKRLLLASGPSTSPVDSLALATRAYSALTATRGDIPEAPEIPTSGPNHRAYGLLAILRAEGQMQGYGNPNCPMTVPAPIPILSASLGGDEVKAPVPDAEAAPTAQIDFEAAAKEHVKAEIALISTLWISDFEIRVSRETLRIGIEKEVALGFFTEGPAKIAPAVAPRLRQLIRASAIMVSLNEFKEIPEVYVYMVGKAIEAGAW
jgi:hypothetical protein